MTRLLCILAALMLWPMAAAAGSRDSTWVKVPVAAVDSVWVKVPAGVNGADAVPEATAERNIPDTVVSPVPTGGRMAWVRKRQSDPVRVSFAWGAEAGSSIDLGEHDMSSVDFNATFGFRYRWINFAGVGAGANIMVSNSCRSYPVFAVFRTDFSGMVRFLFLDIRGGVSLNYLSANVNQTDAYGSASVGFVLSTGKSYRSYITAGYTYMGRRNVMQGESVIEYSPLSMASIRLGITF